MGTRRRTRRGGVYGNRPPVNNVLTRLRRGFNDPTKNNPIKPLGDDKGTFDVEYKSGVINIPRSTPKSEEDWRKGQRAESQRLLDWAGRVQEVANKETDPIEKAKFQRQAEDLKSQGRDYAALSIGPPPKLSKYDRALAERSGKGEGTTNDPRGGRSRTRRHKSRRRRRSRRHR